MEKQKSWAELCLDPRWQRKRLEVLERDGWKCRSCGSSTVTLHVHHSWYGYIYDETSHRSRRRFPWEYENYQLASLCEACHAWEHESLAHVQQDLVDMFGMAGFLAEDLSELFHLLRSSWASGEIDARGIVATVGEFLKKSRTSRESFENGSEK